MTRKGLANKNVISAITIALSATMAMTPVASLAQEVVDPELSNNTVTETVEAGAAAETPASETDAADAQADTAQEAAETAADTVDDLLNNVFNEENPASSDDGGNTASDSVQTFADAAQDMADDKTLRAAADSLADANDQIDDAEEANQAIADALSDGGTNVSIANDIADNIVSNVEKAGETADGIMTDIENTSDVDQISEAVAKLDKLVEDTEKDIEIAKQAVDDLSAQYDAAKVKLAEAQSRFDNAIGTAGADVQAAKDNLEKAQGQVDNLAEALSEAQSDLEAERDAANIIRSAENSVVATWDSQRSFLETFLANYYMPQLVDEDATDLKIIRDKGFTTQDSTRYIASYKDKDGVTHERYFNYDRTDRTYKANDQWADLGKSNMVVVYEKTAEEVAADRYIDDYCKKNKINIGTKGSADFKKRYNSGEFDVFAYEDNGETKFIVRDEIIKGLADGTVTGENDVYTVNGIQARKIIQTNASTAEIKVDVSSDAELAAFLNNAQAYVDKYNAYTDATEAAKEAVKEAKQEAELLSDAIDELKETHSTNTAKVVLGVEDVAKYFELNNITADEAAMLNEMTVDQVVEYLDKLLADAKDKVGNAELQLKDLQGKLAEAEGELDNIMAHITPEAVYDLLGDVEDTPADDTAAPAADSASATADSTATSATTTAPAAATAATAPASQAAPGAAQVGGFAATVDAVSDAANDDGGVLGLARAEEVNETIQAANDEAPATNIFVNTIKETQSKGEGDLVTIKDGQTALSGTLGDSGADAKAMPWWWVMFIAIFGAAGREMYKKHLEKQEAIAKAKAEKK